MFHIHTVSCFYLCFDQINAALISIRGIFKYKKNQTNPIYFWILVSILHFYLMFHRQPSHFEYHKRHLRKQVCELENKLQL